MLHRTLPIFKIIVLLVTVCSLSECTIIAKKTTGITGAINRFHANYAQNKKVVQEKRAIREQMRKELPTTNVKKMDYAQLKIAKKYCVQLEYYERAIKCLERMATLTADPLELQTIRLEIPDLYFELGEFEKAGKQYQQYMQLYPGSKMREHAEYKTILASFYETLQYDRDQRKTKETVTLTNAFLEKDLYTTYRQGVQEIQSTCYVRLVESEISIAKFYARRGNAKAVEKRLAYVKKTYPQHLAAVEADLLALETRLLELQPKATATEPAQTGMLLAQSPKKRSAVDRF